MLFRFIFFFLSSVLAFISHFGPPSLFVFQRGESEPECRLNFFNTPSACESIRWHFLLHQLVEQKLSALSKLQEHLQSFVRVLLICNLILKCHDFLVNQFLNPDLSSLFDFNPLHSVKLFFQYLDNFVALSLHVFLRH